MKTGFYNLSTLNHAELKQFFTDAIMLSYNSHIDILDCSKSWSRQPYEEKSLQDMLDEVSLSNHNVCIDRSVQHDINLYGEIGYSTMVDPSHFLYIYVNISNLQILIDKYNLQEILHNI
jgi:hypothetical protein